ncbi:MAG: glycine zipper family protein [Acidocella sp.]|nr:glycine zipper family protein [Acidocella sp.]
MMNNLKIIRPALGMLLLAGLGGCAVAPPTGPSVVVLPGQGISYSEFQADDATCRDAAAQSVGYASPAGAANQAAVGSAVVGTAIGAVAGAALGAASGNAGAGAAIGAGAGLLVGSASGASNAQASAYGLQRQYDTTYLQCMAAKGNNVPNLPPEETYVAPAPGYYPYPPPYAYYPAYGYLYPSFTFYYGRHWHH